MIWSIFYVTGAEHAAFLAFSGLECGRAVLATELEFATRCAKCYLRQDRKGTRSTKGGSCRYFPYWSYLLMNNTEELYVSGKHFLPFFFPFWCKKGIGGFFSFIYFCFKLFSFPLNSVQLVLRWHWFEHEVRLDDL